MDRSINTTKQRIISLLTRVPQGVSRAGLHGVTGETALIHEALNELIAEGIVTEQLITTVRGKPRRTYQLTKYAHLFVLPEKEKSPNEYNDILPGATLIVEHLVRKNPGIPRSEVWTKAVVTKSWVANALDELVRDGKIVETLEEDPRGGLRRRYTAASSQANDAGAQPEGKIAM